MTPPPPSDGDALQQARSRREALGVAADDFDALLARPASSPEWSARVAPATKQLVAAFGDHVEEVEAEDGLLPQLLTDAPRLAHSIQKMYDEHVEIDTTLASVQQLLEACGTECDSDDIAAVRRAALDVLRQISHHRQAGADLVYDAYSVDIGGG